jgi:flavin reductase (DIM6/NTAB) family NADH-FMN oxidoreductase RutF/DNA-binding GntR family transcriptional regulator
MSTSGAASTEPVVDQAVFRDVIGRFASGVTVITTRVDDRDFGTTASAMSSLSMDPPMLLVCLNKTSETQRAISSSRRFAVNILGEQQSELAYAFARKSPDKFRDAQIERGRDGVPLLVGALAHLECRVSDTATGGTHTIFMGAVEDALASPGEPLAYFRGHFGRFEDAKQDEAYRRLRTAVVTRDLPTGQPLDVAALADRFKLDQAHVYYGLTKLNAEGLVSRQPGGRLIVKPLDVRTALNAVDARCAIEVAVVEKMAGALSEADARTLRDHAESAHAAALAEPPDVEGLLRSAFAFHEHFIGLLRNEALTTLFHRLDLQAIWVRASPALTRHGRPSAAYLIRLVDACVAGDRAEAKRILYKHAERVKAHAREAIESLGGEV